MTNVIPLHDQDRDTALLLTHLEGYITEHYGEPCHDNEGHDDCPTCSMWRVWQDLRDLTDFESA